jgi:GT2 family glycosyltransferase
MYANYKVYVADNGSVDDSLQVLSQLFPEVEVIDLKINYGFAEGYNRALQGLEADYYVLLNSDVEVAPDWIKPVMELMERDNTVAACQPRILDYNRRTHFEYAGAAGGWIDYLGYPFCQGRLFQTIEEDRGQYHTTQEIFWASGAAMFIRAKLFHDIGGFDGTYFAHLEEIDLCWRLKRAGYKIMVRPKSVVYHVGGGTLGYESPRKTYLNFRNSLLTLLKNEDYAKLLWLIPLRLVLDGVAAGLFLVKGKFKNIGAIVKAHWHFFFQFRTTLKRRKRLENLIQRTSISTRPNFAGRYSGSIVWQYYIYRNLYFSKLKARR